MDHEDRREEKISLRQQLTDKTNARRHLIRCAAITAIDAARGSKDCVRVLRDLYPDDTAAALVLRAVSSPAGLSGSGWADALAQSAVADFILNLGPVSAASSLIASGLRLDSAGKLLTAPALIPSPSMSFVGEGEPIPVENVAIGGPTLTPHKIAGIAVITREMAKYTGNAEAIVGALLNESAALSLDNALLGDAASSSSAPAGLRAVATIIPPTAGGDDEAMTEDLLALVGAVSPVGGAAIALVVSPVRAVKLALRRRNPLPFPVLTSQAMPEDAILAIATNALAFAIEPGADIEASAEAILHMEDGTPLGVVSPGGVVAAPVRSTFQTDCIALRVILGVSWALRASGAVAVISGASW